MARDLPSLNAVRVFEAAARRLSFSRAADDLNVTQSAVSRQIKVLEEQLGQPLFLRAGPKLRLTAAGAQYHAKVVEALGILRRGTEELRRGPTITISVLPTFASKWLVPRLGAFERAYPHVAIRVAASYQVIDFTESADIDAAIRLGLGGWPGVDVTRLTSIRLFPVCSPGVARKLRQPEDMRRQRLLVDDSNYDEWPRWYKAAGVDYHVRESRFYDDDSVQLQAAIAGQGVMLARAIVAQDELDAGRLVRPFDISIASAFQYYFVCPPERLDNPGIQALKTWLAGELT